MVHHSHPRNDQLLPDQTGKVTIANALRKSQYDNESVSPNSISSFVIVAAT
jgi:hypothetical protein